MEVIGCHVYSNRNGCVLHFKCNMVEMMTLVTRVEIGSPKEDKIKISCNVNNEISSFRVA